MDETERKQEKINELRRKLENEQGDVPFEQ